MKNDFLTRLKRVRFSDLLGSWRIIPAAVISPIYKHYHPHQWIICEDPMEARDNGYWFFKYVREQHPEQDAVYAINSKSPDFNKVSALGETVEYGSLLHWIMYLSSEKKISSQKAGNPCPALFYPLEVYGIIKNCRIFLQHGIIRDDLKWLYYSVTKMKRLICGAYPEYEFVKNRFGYPKGSICYTGLCRFDGLHQKLEQSKSFILIMPTWREWIADDDGRLYEYEGTRNIAETKYIRLWSEFLRDERICSISKEFNTTFVFYPHRKMQKYLDLFPESNDYLKVLSAKDVDIQKLLIGTDLLVTDYSSVFMDIVYMKKPIVFYQFDYENFRMGQYGEGYFSYENNPFGQSYMDPDSVFDEIERYAKNKYKVNSNYINAHKSYFPLYDTNNCKRVYEVVMESDESN